MSESRYLKLDLSIVAAHGIAAAAVYGIIRLNTFRADTCKASIERMSADLGLTYNTFRKHLDTIIEAGLIEDQTPDMRNHPHTFRVFDPACPSIIEEQNNSTPQKLKSQTSKIEERALQKLNTHTSIIEDDKKELNKESLRVSPAPGGKVYTTTDATLLYLSITGHAAVPSGNMERIDGVAALMNQVGEVTARERMTAAWEGWKTSKTKDGRPYSRTNLAWIDHAITGEVPQGSAPTNAASSVQTNSDGSLYV
jgi:hypothetical protein